MAPSKISSSTGRASRSARAPWDVTSPQNQLFVLITGANSGIGLGIGERLIDEFLATRPLDAQLVLLPTTRSAEKSRATIAHLRKYAERAAATSTALKSRAGQDQDEEEDEEDEFDPEEHSSRIHVLSVQLDLCDIRGIYELAETMCAGTLSNPEGTEGQDAKLKNVTIPRLDSVVFNAAFGGWSGLNYLYFFWTLLVDGFVQSVTWPKCKIASPTRILNQQPSYQYPEKPRLGEVFTACIFGHYLLAHQLLPLLNRSSTSSSDIEPGRIVWSSSLEAVGSVFTPSDIQALEPTTKPYESVKRLTDILSLSHTLSSVRPISSSFLREEGVAEDDDDVEPPRMYLSHPGIVVSTLFPLPAFLLWGYHLALVLARMLGSPWHTVDAYTGAKSAAWLVLEEQDALDELDAERVKWGSATNTNTDALVKATEVEGWSWSGKVESVEEGEEDSVSDPMLKKGVGRHRDVKAATKEDIAAFEDLGRDCWEQMEELREEWEEILELA